jgi:PPK2 family polyphosphate:nucleotide phosphotransferase
MDYRKKFLVSPGKKVDLGKIDPSASGGYASHEEALPEIRKHVARMDELQYLLYADGSRSLLVVLQALDAAGKDGTIRHLFSGMNPQGTAVFGFKQPSAAEAAHDFLWRAHQRVPGKGEIVIFNRSHYEDVLVTRVHGLVPPERIEARYDAINAFEKSLADNDTTIVKFFLHISRKEQTRRLTARLDDPTKRWKFSHGDIAEHNRWDDYAAAYEIALARCSTAMAPWFIVPADRKWYRDAVIARILRRTLDALDLSYPSEAPGLDALKIA